MNYQDIIEQPFAANDITGNNIEFKLHNNRIYIRNLDNGLENDDSFSYNYIAKRDGKYILIKSTDDLKSWLLMQADFVQLVALAVFNQMVEQDLIDAAIIADETRH